MDFDISEEQELLLGTTRQLVENKCPLVRVREIFDGDSGHDAQFWKSLIEIGLGGTGISEEFGGAGLELSTVTTPTSWFAASTTGIASRSLEAWLSPRADLPLGPRSGSSGHPRIPGFTRRPQPASMPDRRALSVRSITTTSTASTLGKGLEWEAQCRFIASRRPSMPTNRPSMRH